MPIRYSMRHRRFKSKSAWLFWIVSGALVMAIPCDGQGYRPSASPALSRSQILTDSVRVLLDHKKFDKAQTLLRDIRAKDPSDSTCALSYCLLSEVSDAIVESKTSSRSKRDGDANQTKAFAYVDSAIACKHDYADAWQRKGNLYFGQMQLEEAAACYDSALAFNPQNGDLWFQKASLALLNGSVIQDKLADLAQWYDNAIKYGARDVAVWRQRGMVLQQLSRYEEALQSYDSALSYVSIFTCSETEQPLLVDRGKVLLSMKRYADAKSYCDSLLGDTNTLLSLIGSYQLWRLRGLACHQLPDPEQAVVSFDSALAYNSSDCVLWYYRGSDPNNQNKFEQALESCTRSIGCDSTVSRFWYLRACCYANLKDYAKAQADCERALTLEPNMQAALELKAALKVH